MEATFAGWLWVVDDDGALRGARWIDGDVKTVKHCLDDAVSTSICFDGYLGELLVVDGGQVAYFDDAPDNTLRAIDLITIAPKLMEIQLTTDESTHLAKVHLEQIERSGTRFMPRRLGLCEE